MGRKLGVERGPLEIFLHLLGGQDEINNYQWKHAKPPAPPPPPDKKWTVPWVDSTYYNIAFVNSERWLAKSRVDITQCQHGKFISLYFFVLYYKKNIKHFFRINIQLYQHWCKLGKLEIVWQHSAVRASCFHTISRFPNSHLCWYNCISTRKMFYIC
jgi:hypothetical protein